MPSQAPVAEPLAFSPKEAARITGLSRSGIYELIKCGDLRAVRSRERIVIPAEELRSYLDGLPDVEPDNGDAA